MICTASAPGVFQLSFTLFRPHDVFGDLSYSLIY
jgi:hypothetical protein